MAIRKADATWEGDLKAGNGKMKTGTGGLVAPFTFDTRFGDAGGTNPEELIGAAHAGCFSMALSGGLGRAGHPPTRIETSAKVHIEKTDAGFRIVRIDLDTRATVPGIDPAKFQEIATATKSGCPVSAALAAVPVINLTATLVD